MAEDIMNSLVGFKSQFKGNVVLSGNFRIDGDFAGKISSTGKVFISETGRVKGDIQASLVIVAGVFEGNIFSTHCHIKSSCVIIGFINSSYIVSELGAMMYLRLSITGNRREKGIADLENIKKTLLGPSIGLGSDSDLGFNTQTGSEIIKTGENDKNRSDKDNNKDDNTTL